MSTPGQHGEANSQSLALVPGSWVDYLFTCAFILQVFLMSGLFCVEAEMIVFILQMRN